MSAILTSLLLVATNVVAGLFAPGANRNQHVQLYPIVVYADGKYFDAVSDVTRPPRRPSPLESTRHFAFVSRGFRRGAVDVIRLSLEPQYGSTCSRFVLGETTDVLPPALVFAGKNLKPRLALSVYTTVVRSGPAYRSPPADPRYEKDVLNVARIALAKVGLHPDPGKGFHDLHVQNLDVMDVYHDGQPEIFARVLGGGNFTFVWLAYVHGRPKVLDVTTQRAVGGNGTGPHFVDTADIDGDGIDEVVIAQSLGTVTAAEIYQVTHDAVRRLFRGGYYGC